MQPLQPVSIKLAKERNSLVVIKFNGKLNVVIPAVLITKKLDSGVFLLRNKVKVS